MNDFEHLQKKYRKLKDEFETYQNFAESTIQAISDKNNKLEKQLDAITNIVEISKYINLNLSNDNLVNVINDMILGILGVTYSIIYIKEKGKFVLKATNISENEYELHKNNYWNILKNRKSFIINSLEPNNSNEDYKKYNGTHSIIGVPVNIRNKQFGFIVVEHTLFNFFNYEHIKFISSIAGQIGIALENNMLYTQVKNISIRDPLLGIYNRKYFFDTVEKNIHKNIDREFGIVMIDLDDFKKCNDQFGHLFGDYVLVKIANIIKDSIYEKDILARYGGEEIIIYIDDVKDHYLVLQRIEQIRKKINDSELKYGNINSSITASFGVSFYPQNGLTIEEVINFSDDLLYKAKRLGKNKVLCA